VVVWGVGCVGGGVVGGGFPLRSNIPRSALCATLDTYNLLYHFSANTACIAYHLMIINYSSTSIRAVNTRSFAYHNRDMI
jgi:hypothetical protein